MPFAEVAKPPILAVYAAKPDVRFGASGAVGPNGRDGRISLLQARQLRRRGRLPIRGSRGAGTSRRVVCARDESAAMCRIQAAEQKPNRCGAFSRRAVRHSA